MMSVAGDKGSLFSVTKVFALRKPIFDLRLKCLGKDAWDALLDPFIEQGAALRCFWACGKWLLWCSAFHRLGVVCMCVGCYLTTRPPADLSIHNS